MQTLVGMKACTLEVVTSNDVYLLPQKMFSLSLLFNLSLSALTSHFFGGYREDSTTAIHKRVVRKHPCAPDLPNMQRGRTQHSHLVKSD